MLCFVPVLHGCVWYVCCYVRKNQSASVSLCRSSRACSGLSRAVIECLLSSREMRFLVIDKWWTIVVGGVGGNE